MEAAAPGREGDGRATGVLLWVDGIYVKAGLEKEKAALLVVIGAMSDGSKELLSIANGYRESSGVWASVLRDLRSRGMNCPKVVVGDGRLGIWGALANVLPEAKEQRCWNHRVTNVLERISKKDQQTARQMLRQIHMSKSQQMAEERRGAFQVTSRLPALSRRGLHARDLTEAGPVPSEWGQQRNRVGTKAVRTGQIEEAAQ